MAEPNGSDRARGESGIQGRATWHRRLLLHRAVPNHFQDPIGLTLRILRSGNPDALSAMVHAGAKLGFFPIDAVLSRAARPRAPEAVEPSRPILFITGPPRSGTTLVHQALIRALPVAYLTNLASLLPRSAEAGGFPLTAAIANERVRLESYYGRTRALSGPSDGLEFWDRWLGPDRRAIPSDIAPAAAQEMRRFFGRLELLSGRPVVAKNNSLLGSAHLVTEVLPTARFVCLRRDPLFLAQSLLKARRDIQGSSTVSYGIDESGPDSTRHADPVEDVWRQVRFYTKLEARQMQRLGKGRFFVVSYEEFCADPSTVARRIGQSVFGFDDIVCDIEPIPPRRRRILGDDEFERLARNRSV